jgi:hypothetical protein
MKRQETDQDESLGLEQLPQSELESNPVQAEARNIDSFKELQDRGASFFRTPDPNTLQAEAEDKPLTERVANIGGEEALRNSEAAGDFNHSNDELEVDEEQRSRIDNVFMRNVTD